MHRIVPIIVSIGAALLVARLGRSYYRYVLRRFGPFERLSAWRRHHPVLGYALFSFPLFCVVAPCCEEAIFRGPLLLGFSSLSRWAWALNAAAALLFGLTHVNNLKPYRPGATPPAGAKAPGWTVWQYQLARFSNAALATGLGVVFGWVTLHYQSLWAGIATHSAWNLFYPLLHLGGFAVSTLVLRPLAKLARRLSPRRQSVRPVAASGALFRS